MLEKKPVSLNTQILKNHFFKADLSQVANGPYSHVTNDKLRLFLHCLHEKSPEKAKKAVDYYVRRMSDLLQQSYTPKVDAGMKEIRVEFAQESIRLPTGHLVTTMPRVHFNYLPDEVFAELQVCHHLSY